ncbi:MAG: DUF3784 domain-containing protein [Sphingobacterium sp.]|jgi:hypothetical protein|nr:DUF3784 domain-containing protein [Sphingobacterium sp.]
MIPLVLILSAVFVTVAFLVTNENADSALSGYNTLSAEEKKQFDIQNFILFFKKFHIILAISYLAIFGILFFMINPYWGNIFTVTYPLLAYIFYIWKANSFFKTRNQKQYYVSLAVISFLCILFLVIVYLFLKN